MSSLSIKKTWWNKKLDDEEFRWYHLLDDVKNIRRQGKYLIYAELLIILISTITGCISVSTYASLVFVPVDITSSAVGIKICAITAEIKKYKSIITKNNYKHDEIVLLDTIEILIFKALVDSYISHYEFVSVNNVLREYNQMK